MFFHKKAPVKNLPEVDFGRSKMQHAVPYLEQGVKIGGRKINLMAACFSIIGIVFGQ